MTRLTAGSFNRGYHTQDEPRAGTLLRRAYDLLTNQPHQSISNKNLTLPQTNVLVP
jgi:hypothetical protein